MGKSKSTSTKVGFLLASISFIVFILIIIFIVYKLLNYFEFGKIKNVPKLLKEMYGEEFEIAYNPGPEKKNASDLPTLEKTGKTRPIVMLKDNNEVKFEAVYDYDKNEIVEDDYIMSLVCYNTARKIERDYPIGDNMYVYINKRDRFNFSFTGTKKDTLFDVDDDQGQVYCYIFYYAKNNNFLSKEEEKEYLKNIVNDLSLNYETKGSMFLIQVKKNGIEEFKEYYKSDNKNLLDIYTTKEGKKLKERYENNFNGVAFEGTIIQ